MAMQKTQNYQLNIEGEKPSGEPTLPYFKTYYKAMVINMV